MGKINEAIHSIHYLDAAATQDKWINKIHPLGKMIVTFSYIFILLSFSKYELIGVLGMLLYPLILFPLGKLSFQTSIRQLRFVFFMVCLVGIANPLLDRGVVMYAGTIGISAGMISMMTLLGKGLLAVLASYLLIITTSIEQICYGLRLIHVPKILVTVLLLIYRYIVVLLKETERLMQAYAMRAPGQKGIHVKVWGPLIGQLLLRSIDRAQLVYESMQLRGFAGEFQGKEFQGSIWASVFYTIVWLLVLAVFRYGFIV